MRSRSTRFELLFSVHLRKAEGRDGPKVALMSGILLTTSRNLNVLPQRYTRQHMNVIHPKREMYANLMRIPIPLSRSPLEPPEVSLLTFYSWMCDATPSHPEGDNLPQYTDPASNYHVILQWEIFQKIFQEEVSLSNKKEENMSITHSLVVYVCLFRTIMGFECDFYFIVLLLDLLMSNNELDTVAELFTSKTIPWSKEAAILLLSSLYSTDENYNFAIFRRLSRQCVTIFFSIEEYPRGVVELLRQGDFHRAIAISQGDPTDVP